jgi:hypothetical protein
MIVLLTLAFLGGVLTTVSPCILPVLPFVFAKADRPFRKTGLPLLAGMAFTFKRVSRLWRPLAEAGLCALINTAARPRSSSWRSLV